VSRAALWLALVGLILAACAGGAAQAPTATWQPRTPPAPFTFSGQKRPLLLAHYMAWYQTPYVSKMWGWHWTMNRFMPRQNEQGEWSDLASHYTPLTGPYDSSDPLLLEYQVQLMKLSGIDGVIVDWYGSEQAEDYAPINQAAGRLFEAVRKAGLKFVICYEDQTVKQMIAKRYFDEAEAAAHGQLAMRYLQETWFRDEAYLKVDGQPLLFVFGPQYFKGGRQWQALFEGIEPQPLLVTLDNPVDTVGAGSYPWPPMSLSAGGELRPEVLAQYLGNFYAKTSQDRYKVGGAFPGFKDIYEQGGAGSSYGYLDERGGETFRATLQDALVHDLDMIQLITWNDYGEGTGIEPTVQFEYRYLELTQAARRAIEGGRFAYTAEDLRLPLRVYELRSRYAAEPAAAAELARLGEALLAGDVKTAAKLLRKYR